MITFQNRFYNYPILILLLLFLAHFKLNAQVEACPIGDIFTYADFSTIPNLYLYNATKKVDNTIQLTSKQGDIGLLYGITKFPVQAGFSSTFSFSMEEDSGEGFSLMIHPDYAIFNLTQAGGKGLGYSGIARNVAIEFDTRQSEGETNDNHISIQTRGRSTNSSHPDFSVASKEVVPDLNDGQIHFAKVVYLNEKLSVFLDDFTTPVVTANLNLGALLSLEDSGAYLIFTAANGATAATQNIHCWSTQTEIDDTCKDVDLEATIELIEPTTCGKATGQAQVVAAGSGSSIGAYTYLWSDGQTLNEAFDLAGGINTVTVTNEAGCSEEFSIEIPDPDQPVTASFSYEVSETTINFSNASTGAITNQTWSGGLPSAILNNSVDLPPTGSYQVCLTVENQCGTTDVFCKTINIGLSPNEPQCVDGDIFTYSDFSTTPSLYMFGDVQQVDDLIQLTGDTPNELSTLYGVRKIKMQAEFQTSFTFQIEDGTDVAEGFALIIHPDFAIYNQRRAGGAGLGYNGISKSVAIEFDVQADVGGLDNQHIAIHSNGIQPNSSSPDGMLAGATLPFELNDGQVHNARIVYKDQQLSVFVDDFKQPIVQTNIDIPAQLNLNPSGAYFVFTAASSNSGATQNILCWSADATAPIIEEPEPEKVVFQTTEIEGESGTTIKLPITAKNFQNILGFQTALQFTTPSIGKITGFADFNLAGLGEEDFNIDDDHQFSVLWFRENPVSLSDDTPLFSVEIELAETTTRTCTQLEKNTTGIITEIIGLGFNKMDAELDFAPICVEPKEIITPSGLALISEDAKGNPGQLLQIPIRVNQFKDILSIQKTIRLSLSGVGRIVGTSNYGLPELSEDNFNFINDTVITLVWFQAIPTTLPDDSIIYTIDVLLLDNEGPACVDLIMDDSRTHLEVADKDLNILAVETITGNICVEIPVSADVYISGTIETEIGQPVRNVTVNTATTSAVKTDDTGIYQLEALTPNTDYELIPDKKNNILQRVSTLDLVIIMKHILDKERLDSPYKMLAADVNQDGRISSVDLVITRQLILNIRSTFPNDLSWLFVPKAYQFPENQRPNIQEVPRSITLLDADGRYINQDFIAVKMGNVSYDLTDGLNTETAQTRTSPPTLPLNLKNQSFEKGDLVKVPITTTNFSELSGYQLALTFNREILTFQQLIPSDQQTNLVVNTAQAENGLLPVLWYATDDATDRLATAKETPLFTITFTAQQAGNLADLLQIDRQILSVEAVIEGNMVTDIALNFASSTVAPTAFQFTKIYPNPATQTAWLAIDNPTQQAAKIQVLNLHGQVLLEQITLLAEGQQTITLPVTNLGDGVYYVAILGEATGERQVHKLLVVNK